MPVTVSGTVLFAVTDDTRAVQVTEARTCASICWTLAGHEIASRETDVFITPQRNAKKSPLTGQKSRRTKNEKEHNQSQNQQ